MKQLGIGRTRLVLALGAAVAAATAVIIVIPATFGSFSDQTTNSGNSAALGTLLVTNSKGGASCTGAQASSTCTAVVNITTLKPGDTVTNSVTLTNSGSLAGAYTMKLLNFSNSACSGTCGGVGAATDLADHLVLWVSDGTHDIYGTSALFTACADPAAASPALSKFTTAATLPPTTGSAWAAPEGHTYTFKICVPSTLGNAYQGTSTSFDIETDGAQTAGTNY